MIELDIVTGVGGAGKSSALYTFEENGFFVTDNVPLEVVEKLLQTYIKDPKKYAKVALAVSLDIAQKTYELAKNCSEFNINFIGLFCEKGELLSRYRLSRRKHPKEANGMPLEEALDLEIKQINDMRLSFTHFIDTTKLSKNEFRKQLIFVALGSHKHDFVVTFVSFGYKRSVPQDVETVFDVRLLPNPYWVPELRELTGLDEKIIRYVLDNEVTQDFLKHVISYLDYYLPRLKESERTHATIGVACSGGQHRSVVIAEYLNKYYSKKYQTRVIHKELMK
ncbi:MAG: RNase adapter RapZ [Bacilli bacterium]|nr:RNase adapter RapZ [Bacilli bacterium]